MGSRFGTMVRKIVAHILLMCCLSFLFAGCDYTKYPNLEVCNWVSTEPGFILEYNNKYPYMETEFLNFNGEWLPVVVSYFPSTFDVIPLSDVDQENNVINMATATVYLSGHWKMRKNELIFYIEEDNLFGGIYEEIHFAREELKKPPAGKHRLEE